MLEIDPDLIIWIGAVQYFERTLVVDPALVRYPVVTFYSEGYYMHEFDWKKRGISLAQRMKALFYRVLRGRMMRPAALRSVVAVGNVPETPEIIELQCTNQRDRDATAEKVITLPLGFNPANYQYDRELRRSIRASNGLSPDDVAVSLSSRMVESKMALLTHCIHDIDAAMNREPRLRAFITGFSDNDTSDQLRGQIAQTHHPDRFICHRLASQSRLNELYNAPDIALFPRASVSCQAALGTGLIACLADKTSMNHLVLDPSQGVFYEPMNADSLADRLIAAIDLVPASDSDENEVGCRGRLVQKSSWLCYDKIIAKVLDTVVERSSAADRPE